MMQASLEQLRQPSSSAEFRIIAQAIARKLATDVSLRLKSNFEPSTSFILVPILRAGIALLPPFSAAFPQAPIGILGIQRDEKTAKASLYYQHLPSLDHHVHILILDPMIATGGTAILAIESLTAKGANSKKIHMVSILASKQGHDLLLKTFPDLDLTVLAIDPHLSKDKMILPGLGDFGDRYFDT
jgi:uracil phosphoribosyltransferase